MKYKETVTVGTIGHVDHGKTRCTEAITKELGNHKRYTEIDKAPEERRRGVTILASHVTYETEKRRYTHIDCPGHEDYVKNMIIGAGQIEIGILVVAGTEGIMEQTEEHVRIAGAVGVKEIVVFINKEDKIKEDEREMIREVVGTECKKLCKENGYSKVKVYSGSALEGAREGNKGIRELIKGLDSIDLKKRRKLGPLYMPIEEIHKITGRGTVMTGKIEKGEIREGMEIEIAPGLVRGRCSGLERWKKRVRKGRAGESVGVLVRGWKGTLITRGMAIIEPGTRVGVVKIKTRVYVYKETEGGRKKGFTNTYKPQMYVGLVDTTVKMEIVGRKMALPGDTVDILISFSRLLLCSVGDRLTLREGRRTVGKGLILMTYTNTF